MGLLNAVNPPDRLPNSWYCLYSSPSVGAGWKVSGHCDEQVLETSRDDISLGLVALINAPSSALSRMLLFSYINLSEEEREMVKGDIGCTRRENNLVYVHIPKTGRSTVENLEIFYSDNQLFHLGFRSPPVAGHHPIDLMMRYSCFFRKTNASNEFVPPIFYTT